jgi:hypothetical protein
MEWISGHKFQRYVLANTVMKRLVPPAYRLAVSQEELKVLKGHAPSLKVLC